MVGQMTCIEVQTKLHSFVPVMSCYVLLYPALLFWTAVYKIRDILCQVDKQIRNYI